MTAELKSSGRGDASRSDADRRRNLPERTAINTVIQGSAADLIKLAMIQIQRSLASERLEARMLLQIHDELVFEVPSTEVDALARLVVDAHDHRLSLGSATQGRREGWRQLGRRGTLVGQIVGRPMAWLPGRLGAAKLVNGRKGFVSAMGLRPPVIGVTGSVAGGKSFVARQLGQCGAAVIDADVLGHEVLRLPEIEAAARQRWGDEIFSSDGQIDRRRLAGRVFAPTTEGQEDLRYLESLTHPLIRKMVEERVQQQLAQSGTAAVVIDAPLLVEAGWNEFCDRIVFVQAPRTVRLARAAAGRGWSEQEFARREARQHSCEEKRLLADVVIDNGGSDESTRRQTVEAWKMLSRPVPAG